MARHQFGILDDVPSCSRYLEFTAVPGADVTPAISALAKNRAIGANVIGFGPGLTQSLGAKVDGLRAFPSLSGAGCEVPSSQADIWVWLRGSDPGDIAAQAREMVNQISAAFMLTGSVNGFKYDIGRDLSGYVDGTENPQGDDAKAVAIVENAGGGLDGSSFVAVQQWVHDLDRFDQFDQDTKDNMIGRRQSDDFELDDAPTNAHTKRTSPGNFTPKSYIVRRSMPWSEGGEEGLMFVAFGSKLDFFEEQLRRMLGHEDGVMDAILKFTRPITGGYYWCPPATDAGLDLSALGID